MGTCDKYKHNLKILKTNDINSTSIEKEVLKIKSKYILFSGYSAEILKSNKINFPILDSLVVTRFISFLRVFSVVKKLIEVSVQYLLSNVD